jgi:hypothetical protein
VPLMIREISNDFRKFFLTLLPRQQAEAPGEAPSL